MVGDSVTLAILPAEQDQVKALGGGRPDNCIWRTFADSGECDAYQKGLQAIGGMFTRVRILYGDLFDLDVELEGDGVHDELRLHFQAVRLREAFLLGMQDALGFDAWPCVVYADDPLYARLLRWAMPADAPVIRHRRHGPACQVLRENTGIH
jgi:hypothetical protein